MFDTLDVCNICGEETLINLAYEICEPCWEQDIKDSANYSDNRYPAPDSFEPAIDSHLEAQYEDRYIDDNENY